MLRSRTREGDDLYSTTCNESETRRLSRSDELLCPNCHNTVRYKNGGKTIAHFAHKPHSNCVVSDYERETSEHLKGKDVLFSWLRSKFPDAQVELEVYIPETEQIADVLVKHSPEGVLKGQRWAIEFQHSPLSEGEWKRRHGLYQENKILDFWVFDADVFLQYSRSQDAEDARRFRDPIKAVYEETGFTYFLDLAAEELTVDCKFVIRSIERYIRANGGMTVENDYTFHDPIDHTEKLSNCKIKYLHDHRYAVIFFEKIKPQVDSRCKEILAEFDQRRQVALYRERKKRFKEIVQHCIGNVSEKHGNVLRSFCLQNKPFVSDDILGMEISAFIDKYRPYVEKIMGYLEEFEQIRKSDELADKVVIEKAPSYQRYQDLDEHDLESKWRRIGDIYEKGFVDEVDSFSIVLYERYEKEINNVKYVVEKYAGELEKLVSMNAKSVHNSLERIDYRLSRYQNEPSTVGYALGYVHCKTTEEIDELITRVKSEIIDYDPFSDFR